MNAAFSNEDTREGMALREEVREFARRDVPDAIRQRVRSGALLSGSLMHEYEGILAARGWYVPHWPRQWGGLEMSSDLRMVLDEELALNDCPESSPFGPDMIGPMLMRFGNDAQKAVFLPRIADLSHHWCQGYSEPNAGSDLASLQTRAVPDGDDYIVNGTKIWTSGAHHANWMFALVRTGGDARPQEGISFLLVDMRSAGISLRPIIGLHGWHLFNQVFLDNVRVPQSHRVGEENMGWTIAKSVLESERLKLSRVAECHRRLARAKFLAQQFHERGGPVANREWFRLRLSALEARLMALQASVAAFRRAASLGAALGPETGRLKLRGSQLVQDLENLCVDIAGPATLAYDPAAHAGEQDDPLTPWYCATASARRFMSRGFTIAGGSSEIQRNQLAKQVLGL